MARTFVLFLVVTLLIWCEVEGKDFYFKLRGKIYSTFAGFAFA